MGLMTQFTFAQNAPTSTYEGPVIIDKPVPSGLGLKVEGGYTWLHNDDNGANSSVLKLGIYKNSNTPNFQIYSSDGGGHNYMTTHGGRWGSHFRWTRGSNDGRQFMASIGGDDSYGQYLRLYGVAPDSANVVKVLLRTRNHSYINSTGRFGLGTNAPTEKLDVDGGARFRNIPFGGGNLLMIDGAGKFWQKPVDDFLSEHGLDGSLPGDNLGNHCATMDLDMKGFDINNATEIYASNRVQVGIPGLSSITTIQQSSIEINQIAPMDDSKILKLMTGADKNDIDSKGIPLVLNGINGQNVGVGGVPNEIPGALNVTFDIHRGGNNAPVRVRNLPLNELPIVTVDSTGVLHQSYHNTYDLMNTIAHLQAQIDELRVRIEILENP